MSDVTSLCILIQSIINSSDSLSNVKRYCGDHQVWNERQWENEHGRENNSGGGTDEGNDKCIQGAESYHTFPQKSLRAGEK